MTETAATYFERLWTRSTDPWEHAERWYERRKYALTVEALPWPRYGHIMEPACGAGVLTERLAARADQVSASDRFPQAVAATSIRCAGHGNVAAEVRDVRTGPPTLPYDGVVLSEVLYYFSIEAAMDTMRAWYDGCSHGGHLVLVHHRPDVADHVLTGDVVHAAARDELGPPLVQVADPGFLIDVFVAR